MSEEKFREWNFRGSINIKYVDGSGSNQVFTINQQSLLNRIISIVENYQAQNITLTNRQLYYQLVASDFIPNADKIYKRICKFLTDARYAGLIDWEAIEDRGRVPSMPSEWDSISRLIKSACYSYRLPRWKDQDYYVELYCEKQAMESVLKPIADKYHIYFGCNKGYSSASVMYDLSKRIKDKIEEGKRVVILYLGDHDPSGLDMIRDIKERIEEFLTKGDDYINLENEDGESNFEIIPVALNIEQIRKYNPPPNPTKITDPRAGWYISQFGKTSWELDALKPEILIRLTENQILNCIDIGKYNAWIELENKEKVALEKFGNTLTKKELKNNE